MSYPELAPEGERCLASATFWPDDEACEAECWLFRDHEPADQHYDEILGGWGEGVLATTRPD